MSGNITVSSTTDSQEQVDAAAEYGQQTLPLTEEEKAGTSEVEQTGTAADSDTAEEPEENEEEGGEEEAEEPEEEAEPPEAAEAKPPGQTRRGLAAQIRRQAAEIQELRELVRKHVPPEAQQAQPPAKSDLPKRPDSGDPKYRGKQIEDVMEDMLAWSKAKDEQDKVAQQEAENQRQRTELATKVRDRYQQQAQAANQKYADFAELVNPLHPGQLAEERIMVMSNGAEVAYHIARNPDVLQQLLDWDVSGDPEDGNRIVQTLQNISDQLKGNGGASRLSAPSSSHRSPQPRPAAPRPLRHVGGTSATTSPPVDPGSMSQRDYNAWRNAGGGR